jgi:hypothetical protein
LIDSWKVLAALRMNFAIDGTDEELMPLCSAAAAELEVRLRENADENDIRLINAAASSVNYRLCMKRMNTGEEITSFKAGDVSISVSPSALIEKAEKEKSEAMLLALPLLADNEFVFRQVVV